MNTTILSTKLHIPPPRSKIVLRPRLCERLNEGLAASRKLTLISAAAGFGKSTLISEWCAACGRPVAWLSLDEGDSDLTRFLTYLIAALQTIAPNTGARLLDMVQSPQPPSAESILTALINDIASIPDPFILVLDDYHLIEARPVDDALAFLLEHLPPQMHLVIATREDPHLPLARLRARSQLTELRAADLRFTPAEASEFLNQVMGLNIAAADIAALEARTEGWIAGLQLAALSMQGQADTAGFIQSFTGSNHFVLDYLMEEVLQQQSEGTLDFLLHTSILDRMCGPLCDAVLDSPSATGQETLESLDRANLFIVSLDTERRWFRYHHLFAELLRQRLQQRASSENEAGSVAEYHIRASRWFEDHGLEIEAFQHAAAVNDIERAKRLMEGKGMPLHVRGALVPVLNWLESLPATVLNEKPMLWVMHAGALTTAGQIIHVESKLQAAEAALQGAVLDIDTRDILGRIANNRATLAFLQHETDTVIVQAHRALAYLRPDNLPVRCISTWALGAGYLQKGDRIAASRTFTEAISCSQRIGHSFVTKLATIGLGNVQEKENRLFLAADTYRHALQLFGDQPLPSACEAHLGLARISYEWNNLDAAEQYGQQSLKLAHQFAITIGRFVICEAFLARLMLARGDTAGAAARLAEADQSIRQHDFVYQKPEVASAQIRAMLRQGNLDAAAHLAQTHQLPISQARVHLALGDTSSALAVLEPLRHQMEAKGWQDERLKVMVLQAVALYMHEKKDDAVQVLDDALALAKPGGFIRIFVDEGAPMANLLREAAAHGVMPDYVGKLLTAFDEDQRKSVDTPDFAVATRLVKPIVEPLRQRELEVLQLIAQGFSNQEISKRLFIALDTVKGHNRRIFEKLHVHSRTEAIARARELGLLQA